MTAWSRLNQKSELQIALSSSAYPLKSAGKADILALAVSALRGLMQRSKILINRRPV